MLSLRLNRNLVFTALHPIGVTFLKRGILYVRVHVKALGTFRNQTHVYSGILSTNTE